MQSKWASYIDHTALKPETSKEEILALCDEAKTYSFMSVCINPAWVKTAAEELGETDVKVCTVIGFPLGASTTETKVFETKNAIENGADEIDMVINIGALKSGDLQRVREDIEEVVKEAGKKALVKVIIETSLLTDEEKKIACCSAAEAGADFVKTSTGFSGGGATVEDVRLMRETVGAKLGVKASGGIRTFEVMKHMIEAGASRIGASAGVEILKESTES